MRRRQCSRTASLHNPLSFGRQRLRRVATPTWCIAFASLRTGECSRGLAGHLHFQCFHDRSLVRRRVFLHERDAELVVASEWRTIDERYLKAEVWRPGERDALLEKLGLFSSRNGPLAGWLIPLFPLRLVFDIKPLRGNCLTVQVDFKLVLRRRVIDAEPQRALNLLTVAPVRHAEREVGPTPPPWSFQMGRYM